MRSILYIETPSITIQGAIHINIGNVLSNIFFIFLFDCIIPLKDPIINAEVYVTLNGSRSKLFIDPEVDLTTLQDDFKPKDWILDN